MTDNNNSQRRIFIREHVYKRDNYLEQVEFEFIDDLESYSSIERNYSLWLTRDHYIKTILRRYGYSANKMPTFEEYIDTIRPLIAGHCCSEHELRRAFNIFDQHRNGIIELHEFYRFISIIGRSTTEEKILNFIERVNMSDDRNLNYEQFKQFVRLGHGRDMLVNVSLEE
ncbi:unnamed protein product [Rotaria sp. Silwood2]|nr:unnamed protein product [Rotaria sp. Silwood2]CAF2632674.1 unnamed protein product [Rotaria sp. Silwood2]CAF2887803.1 unnamed protein product [Rotaria sp. Silwood2]CAF3863152.1 unnamed protein product [Rotaria sp. Silwood2]CAF4056048.1 unnamed protein product [Rotaria sp. Silwood2]